MKLIVNGRPLETDATSIATLLRALDYATDGRGMAVAVNDAVVPRDRWDDVALSEGDRVEIIRATQGG
ncbi:sulfur carrier protein ThiS [Rhodocaloribacter litoris]|uniref:sulfur carrier protein ThiS n=1 Tax=Rhodocaloribacter litoris TaxID=2558931 RepID=UPI001423042B|nr:sulfur carrier protein ThiS [Rhodocaloribacter litoris]QXD16288.1 sulfur carrier protein ThiS [Rhodocaloribacter litoris]GIV60892.1 MAG: thiamine biosynthesis protein ThiS [Rhodothermaceae bacterium]